MPKPQYSNLTALQGYLTPDQMLWIMTADPETGDLHAEAPVWMVEECHDRGLVTPSARPEAWTLSADGWDAWRVLAGSERL